MRVAHIVTYISVDGAFGGPVAVALAQTDELARQGHEVDLLAGWDGKATLPASDVTHRLFPVKKVGPGFSGLIAPGLIAHLRAHVHQYDAIHVHLARDLITLPAARIALGAGRRVVAQPHGMIMPDARLKARVLDALVTRNVLRRASTVFSLTDADRDGLATVANGSLPSLAMIPNGIPRQRVASKADRSDPPVVMFLARLHPRKRVLAFAEAAQLMIARGSNARFEIFGPDEGDLPALQAFVAEHALGERVVYRGTVPQGASCDELRRASLYVLPAVREIFPMTVLESMSVGTPVVIGEDCGIAPELGRRGAAVVSDGSPADLATRCLEVLADEALRARLIDRATDSVATWFGIDSVAERLTAAYS
jgi:glycosyltransferase involved in cell wall biosynthesis